MLFHGVMMLIGDMGMRQCCGAAEQWLRRGVLSYISGECLFLFSFDLFHQIHQFLPGMHTGFLIDAIDVGFCRM